MNKKPEGICVFGDSTAWGAWDLEKGGWVSRLWFHVAKRDEEDYVEINNLSISGGTSETILARFENEATIREADALIFQTGGNDSSCPHGTDVHRVPPEQFEKNIQEIIDRARKITENIIFIGFKNCDESKTIPVSWIDIDYKNEYLKKYNDIMKGVCERNDVLYIDVFDLLVNEDFDDGLHPNASGHEKIFVTVRDFLTKKAWI